MTFQPKGQFQQFVVDKLRSIEDLNIKQNGVINNNAKSISKLEIWKAKIIGALIIMNTIFIPIVILLFIDLIKK